MTQQPLEVKRELSEIGTNVKKEKNYCFDFYGLSQRIDILAIIYTRGVEFLTDSNNRAPPPPPPPPVVNARNEEIDRDSRARFIPPLPRKPFLSSRKKKTVSLYYQFPL